MSVSNKFCTGEGAEGMVRGFDCCVCCKYWCETEFCATVFDLFDWIVWVSYKCVVFTFRNYFWAVIQQPCWIVRPNELNELDIHLKFKKQFLALIGLKVTHQATFLFVGFVLPVSVFFSSIKSSFVEHSLCEALHYSGSQRCRFNPVSFI